MPAVCHEFGTPTSLATRLRYLVSKYADHAPYWQFGLWVRQVALWLAPSVLQDLRAIPQAGISVAPLVLSVALQYKWKPFAEPRQNRLEMGGLCISLLLLVMGMLYDSMRSSALASDVVDVAMLTLFFLLWGGLGTHFVRSDLRATERESTQRHEKSAIVSSSNVASSASSSASSSLGADVVQGGGLGDDDGLLDGHAAEGEEEPERE